MKRSKEILTKVLGLQHPHDKIVGVFQSFSPKGKVLDTPAGTGIISLKLRELGFEVTAADINPQFFKAKEISFEWADLNLRIPFDDGSFDYVFSSEGIEHLEDQYHFVRECYRVLGRHGKLIITTPNLLNMKSRLFSFTTGFRNINERPQNEVDAHPGGSHINLVNYFQLRTNLHRNGFRITEVTTHEFSRTAMLLVFLIPIVFLSTYHSFRRERNPEQIKRNEQILKHVFSADLLFGKKLILIAEKDEDYLLSDDHSAETG
jgi:2-polyprenyl-3-methyl-5-hydroxy-6-metoxy-1,4-benzoquinol methylase